MSKVEEGGSSQSTIEIKILTLDSQSHLLRVERCVPVLTLREQIAMVTGVQPERQRLISGGRVLRDGQLLSEYKVEDGHTLHLVVRDPQTTNNQPGHDYPPSAAVANGAPRVFVGNPHPPFHVFGASQLNNPRTESQVPPCAAHPQHQPPQEIQDSLTTLSHYLNRVGHEFAHIIALDGNTNFRPPFFYNSTAYRQGLPTVESLGDLMRATRHLLINHAAEGLRIAGRQLRHQSEVTDETTRRQIQTNVLGSGIAIQNLGALLLELGRTTMMLRMGETPANAVVNSGSALYINENAPNPIMALPSPVGSAPTGAVRFDARMRLGYYPAPRGQAMSPMRPVFIAAPVRPQQPVRPMNVTSGQVRPQPQPGNARPVSASAQQLQAALIDFLRSLVISGDEQPQQPTASTDANIIQPTPASGASGSATQTAPARTNDEIFPSGLIRDIMLNISQNSASASAAPSTDADENGQGSSTAHGTSSGSTSTGRQTDRPPSPSSKRQRRE